MLRKSKLKKEAVVKHSKHVIGLQAMHKAVHEKTPSEKTEGIIAEPLEEKKAPEKPKKPPVVEDDFGHDEYTQNIYENNKRRLDKENIKNSLESLTESIRIFLLERKSKELYKAAELEGKLVIDFNELETFCGVTFGRRNPYRIMKESIDVIDLPGVVNVEFENLPGNHIFKSEYDKFLNCVKPSNREEILEALADKKRSHATELIVEIIKGHNHIYTTRDDDKEQVWIYSGGIYIPQGKTYIIEICREILGSAYTGQLVNNVIQKIEADTYINQDIFFKNVNPERIAIENGILNIKTRELHPFSPREIYFNRLPIRYDPDNKCPAIEKHLETVLESDEDVQVFYEAIGHCLLRDYMIEKAGMFTGSGRNGKGKTLGIIKAFLGYENCAGVPIQQFENDQYAKGELFNKLANLAGDIDSNTLKNTGAFKTLTGRDFISAQRKFLPMVNFENHAKLFFAANKLPASMDDTLAFWERWFLLVFNKTFVTQEEYDKLPESERKEHRIIDPDILKKLTSPEELNGLLIKALDGLDRLFKNKDYTESKNSKNVREIWIRKSDSFRAFLMDTIEEDWEGQIHKSVLRKSYSQYCKKHKLKMSSDKVMKDVLTREYPVSEEAIMLEGERFRVWEGIKMITQVTQVTQGISH